MTISSAQQTYSTASDTITLNSDYGVIAQELDSVLSDVITITSSGHNYVYGTGTSTLSGTVNLNNIDASVFTWKLPEEWVDSFPDYNKVKEMCDTYPAFKIAFDKFKQMYDLVEDDYEAKKGNKYVP